MESGQDNLNHISQVTLLNKNSPAVDEKSPVFQIETKSEDADFTLETKFLKATFSGITGRLKSVTSLSDGVTHKSELEFIQYGTRAHKDKSGAYLFLPDGEARVSNSAEAGFVLESSSASYIPLSELCHRAILLKWQSFKNGLIFYLKKKKKC